MRNCISCGCRLVHQSAELCGACSAELLARVGLGIQRDADGFARPVLNLTRPRAIRAESEVEQQAQPAGFSSGRPPWR